MKSKRYISNVVGNMSEIPWLVLSKFMRVEGKSITVNL